MTLNDCGSTNAGRRDTLVATSVKGACMILDRIPRLGVVVAALLAALFGGLLVAAPASAQNTSRITCESWQFRPAQCQVPGIVDAQLANVIAGDCRPGNWGSDRNGVWVNNGCRAVFNVTSRGGGWGNGNQGGNQGGNWGGNNGRPGQIVRCESWQFRPARCTMDTRGGAQLQRVIAGDCRPGNWGFDRGNVWVINGCRADFVSGGGNYGGNYGGNGGGGGNQIIECNSIRYQPARCSVRINSGVQVDRVLGGECIQGRTWGWDRGGIWVEDGCRARFRIF